MKSYLLLIVFLFFDIVGFSQSKKDLQVQVTTLTSDKQKLIDEKQKLMEDILNLKQQILDLKTENLSCRSENEKLRTALATNNDASTNTPNSLISTQISSASQTSTGRCQAITAKGTQCTRTAESGSKYCWQHKSTYEPASTATSSSTKSNFSSGKSSGSTTSGRTIYTGPRGGKYYINSHGNKTYIKK
jgi:colicin import membrane protein